MLAANRRGVKVEDRILVLSFAFDRDEFWDRRFPEIV